MKYHSKDPRNMLMKPMIAPIYEHETSYIGIRNNIRQNCWKYLWLSLQVVFCWKWLNVLKLCCKLFNWICGWDICFLDWYYANNFSWENINCSSLRQGCSGQNFHERDIWECPTEEADLKNLFRTPTSFKNPWNFTETRLVNTHLKLNVQ